MKRNERNAGRKKNTWTSSMRSIPDPIWDEISVKIQEWKKQQKEKSHEQN